MIMEFDYNGNRYSLEAKPGTEAAITLPSSHNIGGYRVNSVTLYAGYSEKEIINMIESGELTPMMTHNELMAAYYNALVWADELKKPLEKMLNL
jgi:hypothetical protein